MNCLRFSEHLRGDELRGDVVYKAPEQPDEAEYWDDIAV